MRYPLIPLIPADISCQIFVRKKIAPKQILLLVLSNIAYTYRYGKERAKICSSKYP